MTISSLVAGLALCLLSIGGVTGQEASEPSPVERQITGTLRQMYEAEKRKDIKFVLANLAEDFSEVAGDGNIYHRADIEAGWQDVILHDYKLSEFVFRSLLPDAAILTYKLDVDATYKGKPFPGMFRVTTVWTRQQGRWLIRFEQGTIIPEAPKQVTP